MTPTPSVAQVAQQVLLSCEWTQENLEQAIATTALTPRP